MKNILFVENLFNPEKGGVQRVTYVLAGELVKLGYNVSIAYFENDEKDSYNTALIRVIKFELSHADSLSGFIRDNNINIIINQLARNVKLVNILNRITKNTNIKVISCLHTSPNCSWLAAKWLDVKHPKYCLRALLKLLVLSVYRVDKSQMLNAYNKSDMFVLLSDGYIEETKKMLNVDGKKLVAIGNPNTYLSSEIIKKEKLKEVLVVSRINESPKRISKVLDIWSIVSKEVKDWHLRIVGEGDSLLPYIKRIEKEKIERVHFEGRQDPKPYYESASLFLMTSVFEGFGMTITESMQFGLVPVAFDSCAVFRTIISHNYNGIIVPECDVPKYAEEVIRLIIDKEERHRLANNAKLDVLKYDKEIIAQKWSSIFEVI